GDRPVDVEVLRVGAEVDEAVTPARKGLCDPALDLRAAALPQKLVLRPELVDTRGVVLARQRLVVTPPPWQPVRRDLLEQRHEPAAFVGGAQLRPCQVLEEDSDHGRVSGTPTPGP